MATKQSSQPIRPVARAASRTQSAAARSASREWALRSSVHRSSQVMGTIT
jgi:hypothetical protein